MKCSPNWSGRKQQSESCNCAPTVLLPIPHHMERTRKCRTTHLPDQFQNGISLCYHTGKLMNKKCPPILPRLVRKYKLRCLLESERDFIQRSKPIVPEKTEQDEALNPPSSIDKNLTHGHSKPGDASNLTSSAYVPDNQALANQNGALNRNKLTSAPALKLCGEESGNLNAASSPFVSYVEGQAKETHKLNETSCESPPVPEESTKQNVALHVALSANVHGIEVPAKQGSSLNTPEYGPVPSNAKKDNTSNVSSSEQERPLNPASLRTAPIRKEHSKHDDAPNTSLSASAPANQEFSNQTIAFNSTSLSQCSDLKVPGNRSGILNATLHPSFLFEEGQSSEVNALKETLLVSVPATRNSVKRNDALHAALSANVRGIPAISNHTLNVPEVTSAPCNAEQDNTPNAALYGTTPDKNGLCEQDTSLHAHTSASASFAESHAQLDNSLNDTLSAVTCKKSDQLNVDLTGPAPGTKGQMNEGITLNAPLSTTALGMESHINQVEFLNARLSASAVVAEKQSRLNNGMEATTRSEKEEAAKQGNVLNSASFSPEPGVEVHPKEVNMLGVRLSDAIPCITKRTKHRDTLNVGVTPPVSCMEEGANHKTTLNYVSPAAGASMENLSKQGDSLKAHASTAVPALKELTQEHIALGTPSSTTVPGLQGSAIVKVFLNHLLSPNVYVIEQLPELEKLLDGALRRVASAGEEPLNGFKQKHIALDAPSSTTEHGVHGSSIVKVFLNHLLFPNVHVMERYADLEKSLDAALRTVASIREEQGNTDNTTSLLGVHALGVRANENEVLNVRLPAAVPGPGCEEQAMHDDICIAASPVPVPCMEEDVEKEGSSNLAFTTGDDASKVHLPDAVNCGGKRDVKVDILDTGRANQTNFLPVRCSVPDPVPSMDYVDQSLVSTFAFGSAAFKFYHSWPSEVVLRSGEKNGKWNMKLESNHCPFCKPKGRCRTVKELLDHLDTHHSHFAYRPRRFGNTAFIFMKLRDIRQNVDPMFIVGAEGYMLSAKMKKKHQEYCGTTHRRNVTYPFVLRKSHYSAERGNFFHGVPGSVPLFGKSKDSLSDATESSEGLTKHGSASSKSSSSPGVNGSRESRKSTSSESEMIQKRPRRRPREVSTKDTFSGVVRRSKPRTAPKNVLEPTNLVAKPSRRPDNPLKRSIRDTPQGMENQHTQHIRMKMFGEEMFLASAGEGNSLLCPDAAAGRLFHSVTNIPVDSQLYNEGLDSDGDDERATDVEKRWRRRCREDLIDDFVDSDPRQKYFLSLWNHYAYDVARGRSDKDALGILLGFAEEFGGEVKRMKLEAEFMVTITHMWKHGLMDVAGVHHALQVFRDCDTSSNKSGAPHPKFEMAQRAMREEDSSLQQHTYQGLREINDNVKIHEGMFEWVRDEANKSHEAQSALKATIEANTITEYWMSSLDLEDIPSESRPGDD